MNAQEWRLVPSKAILFCAIVLLFISGVPEVFAGPAESIRDIGRVDSGQCLYTSLQEKQFSSRSIQQIVTGLRPYMDFGKIRPDTAYHYVLAPSGKLLEFTIEFGDDLLHLTGGRKNYLVRRWKVPRRTKIDTVHGQIDAESERIVRIAGEAGDLPHDFEEILSQDLELGEELQPEDRFRLVVEKIYGGDWLLGYGTIEAFEIRRGRASFLAVRYKGDYYDQTGRSLKKQFLRVPLHYQFISSEFMKKRRHPILGGVRPHRGIDFAAPYGTPVWAIADGQVMTAGCLKGFGRTVILRHKYGYESLYAHLSDFGPGVREGGTIRQKQIVGYIGTSGLSTGPHLHFGLTRDGVYRDPLKESFPRSAIVGEAERQDFEAKRDMVRSVLCADRQTADTLP